MWKDLSMAEKAHIIALGVQSGITDLNNIRLGYNSFANEDIKNYNKFDDGGPKSNKVNYYNPITGENYGDTMPEGMSIVRRFEDLTPLALDEYMASRPTQLDELVVTPTMTAKDIASGIFSKENWDAHKEEAIEIASFLPIIGDGIDVYDIGKDAKDGNYLEATLGTGLLVLPNIIEKPLKKGYRFVKSLFKNKNINKDATERLLKAVQNYKGSTGRAGYGVSNLKKELKKEGIDVSRFSTEDLSILQRAREMELQKSIPNGSRVSFVRPFKNDGYSVELLDSKGSLGTLDLEDVTTDPGLDINFIKSIRKDEHKVGEDLYNSGIVFSNSIGRKGIVSGTHLLSPNKTISTMKHFPNKVLINNKGEYDFLGKTTYNNPIYRLESPGERPVVPTRDMTVFSSDIIDDNGNFIIDWSSPRLDYKNGGKLNRRQR